MKNKKSQSGFWIAISTPVYLAGFAIWEFIQILRGKPTKSQYSVAKAKEGNKWWLWYTLLIGPFLMLLGPWLFFHLEAHCIWFNLWCDLSIPWLDIG